MNLRPEHTLGFARMWLRNQLAEGEKCPCCGQFSKIYRRNIHHTMASALIKLYNAGGELGYVHVASIAGPACEAGKLRFWGLLEPDPRRRGWWRLTQRGVRFVKGEESVRKYAHTFNNELLFSSGPTVTINDCLGSSFDYAALMRNDD